MVAFSQLVLSPREQAALSKLVNDSITDDPRFPVSPIERRKKSTAPIDHNAAALRAATRVYLGTYGALKGLQALLATATSRRPNAAPRKPLIPLPHRFALSLASLLFFHRILYRLLTRLRLRLLHQKIRSIESRWPKLHALLTSRITPAIGASLSALALGINPASQLRVTLTIYALVRTGELSFAATRHAGYLKNLPKWFGSWILFALAQGQLLHAFVFDPDCFPDVYGNFIIGHTPEYIQRRPSTLSPSITWPTTRQIVDSLAEMANLNWPAFKSPALRPNAPSTSTLPATINPIIAPITSRAHPALQNLSCALLHPAETSCFTPFLRQILLSFASLLRFFTPYYSAFALLRARQLAKSPPEFLSRLARQIFRVTAVCCGAVATSWGTICFFQTILPNKFIPRFRFFVGGALGGALAIFDQSPTGHENAMYVTRTSLDSLWKVGRKRGWWRPVGGGDVLVLMGCLAAVGGMYDLQREGVGKERTMALIRLLRGDIEVGLQDKKGNEEQREKVE